MLSMTNSMKKCYLDSNVLTYWNNDLAPAYQQAVALIEHLQKEDCELYVSPLVLDELIHAIMLRLRLNNAKSPYLDAALGLGKTLDIPKLIIINPPTDSQSQTEILPLMENFSLRPRDAYHLLTMQANKVDGFATFDTDFKKVFAAKLLEQAKP